MPRLRYRSVAFYRPLRKSHRRHCPRRQQAYGSPIVTQVVPFRSSGRGLHRQGLSQQCIDIGKVKFNTSIHEKTANQTANIS
jgi:hypothetical protein